MNVLMMYRYAIEQEARLRDLLSDRWIVDSYADNAPIDELEKKLACANAVISPRFPTSLPPSPQLGFIQSPVAGYDNIDFGRVPADCQVCNVFEHEIGVSEYALSAMLEWQIRLSAIDRRFRAGSWEDGVAALGPTHGELHGKTIGIVSVGHIGRAIAARAKVFGTKLLGVTRSPSKQPDFDWVGGMSDLAAMLPKCDFVVLACPLSAQTTGLIDTDELTRCKSNAVIVNLARGPVVTEDALYRALKENRIGGAILDVWYNNPVADSLNIRPSRHPFHELDNVIMTPHCSSWSEGLLERRWRIISQNLENYADGKPLVNVVRRPD